MDSRSDLKNEQPPLEELSPAELKQFDRAQQIVVGLEKSTRAQKLYLPNNQILQQHRDNINLLFKNYFKEYGELALKVKPHEFLFLERAVYRNTNNKESFAFRLYNEGMRAIRFSDGLEPKELDDFMALLNAVILDPGTSAASTTMLWEREFPNITYEIAEYILDEQTNQIEGKVEQILDPSMEHYLGPSSVGPPEDIEENIDPKSLIPPPQFKKIVQEICVLDEKEFEQIQREIANGEKHERLMMDMFDIMVTMILEERNEAELGALYKSLLEAIDGTVLHGELHITSQLLWALRGMLEGGTGDFAMRHPDRILQILDSLGETDRIGRYLNSLNLGYSGSVKDIVNFFASLPKRAFPILLNQIHIVTSPQLRKEISIAISQIYDQDTQHFAKAFKAAKSPAHLLDVLFVLSHTRDNKATPYLQPLLQHQNRSVRLAAVTTLRELSPKEAATYMSRMIEDPDPEIRVSVVRTLANSGDSSAGLMLLEKIKTEPFQTMELSEKRIYFYSTAKLLGDELIVFLRDTLNNNPFFRKQHLDEMQQCAAFALGVIGSEAAVTLLKAFEKHGSKNVKLYCAKELKRGSAA